MTTEDCRPVIVCISHLAWDFVWQRPQHILSRLARRYPVVYVNEPEIDPASRGEPEARLVADEANVTAWQPVFPDRADVIQRWRDVYTQVVQDLLLRQGRLRRRDGRLEATRALILWFYTPMPFYLMDHLPADVIVYDAMDELANFKNAAHDLREREGRLMARADLVFTGGKSLYETRRGRHPRVHMFLSGVDPEHFARAQRVETEIAPELAALSRPILGYYGVIDERVDLELLRALAAGQPDWSIAMVGPVAKIQEEELPRLPNLHYLGRQPYGRLPNFLKAFDVCLMPFALNEATRYISPTKTLEYMAAHKSIVSTPVPDVVSNWGEVVYVAQGARQFASAVREALAETEVRRGERAEREAAILARSTWDHIAGQMGQHLAAALERRVAENLSVELSRWES
jgi:glycosyltransferase involved in cell wall biosynthesis